MSEIRPALTPEEWKLEAFDREFSDGVYLGTCGAYLDPGLTVTGPGDDDFIHVPIGHRPALAALCLYGQPFGFTREDVEVLRDIGGREPFMRGTAEPDPRVNNLADRIEALLAPEDA